MGEKDVAALLRLGGILFTVSAVRLAALVVSGPPPALPPATDRLDELVAETTAAIAEAERRARPLEVGERIPINRADEDELDRLPRVGPSLARAIVEERNRGGAFPDLQALTRIRGVGLATAQRWAPHLEFSGGVAAAVKTEASQGRRVSLGRATEAELLELPGIGPALARRILAARTERPFRSVEDLAAVPGIGPAKLAQLRGRVAVP